MKNVITGFLLVIGSISYAQEGWVNLIPSSSEPGLIGVYPVDSENVWVVGEEGRVLHTIDGGYSWESVNGGVTEALNTVEFLSPDTGWVAGNDDAVTPTVLRTTDGGSNWESQYLPGAGAIPMYDIDFIRGSAGQPTRGFITGGLGFTWRTEDYGGSWVKVRNFCENTFYSSCFVNRDRGWFVGTPSVAEPYTIMRTTNGGDTWEEQTNPTGRNLRGVCFGADQRGLAVGLSGALLYTSDGGETWESRPGGEFTRFESVFLLPSGKAWAVGANSTILYSTDWGYTWEAQESGLSSGVELWEVYFIDDNEGWIVGGGMGQPGVILHTTTGGVVTSVEEASSDGPRDFRLSQNYPNPFNPSTTIEYSLPGSSYLRLEIINLFGEHVRTLYKGVQSGGFHSALFDAEGLPSGIYFYRLQARPLVTALSGAQAGQPKGGQAGDFVQTKKLLLLK